MKTLKINVPEGYEVDQEKSTFEEIVFKVVEKKLPKSWEELKTIEGYFVTPDALVGKATILNTHDDHKNIFFTAVQAKASIALAQLSQLREVYRDGWKPDWSDESYKACIVKVGNNFVLDKLSATRQFLAFQSAEIRDEFFENFRDLIEEASPLLF